MSLSKSSSGWIIPFWVVFIVLSGARGVSAHKVSVFAWVQGDTVYVESKFSGGRKPRAAPVEVYDEQGEKLLTGVTDQQGAFTFKVPKITPLKVVLLAGMGHRAEWVIPEEEVRQLDIKVPSNEGAGHVRTVADDSAMPVQAIAGTPVSGLSTDEIEAAVDRALNKKMRPMMKILAEIRDDRPTIKDILGGIGYILGLIGLIAYMRYRK